MLPGDDTPEVSLLVGLPWIHGAWAERRRAGDNIPHPLTPLLRAWRDRPRPVARRRLILTEGKGKAAGLLLARTPGLAALS